MLGKTSSHPDTTDGSRQRLEDNGGLVKGVESPVKNGFVRPVAVASIFRPAAVDENSSKKPAVPEKRRFSTLIGDFTPCNDSKPLVSNDEFARRRQSWDTRTASAAVPFGQNLLKKTVKVNKEQVQAVKTHEATNGCLDTSTQSPLSIKTSSSNQTSSSISTKSRLEESSNPESLIQPSTTTTTTTWTAKANSCQQEQSIVQSTGNDVKVSSVSCESEIGGSCSAANVIVNGTSSTKKVYGLLRPRKIINDSPTIIKTNKSVDEISKNRSTEVVEKKVQVNSISSTSESVVIKSELCQTKSPSISSLQAPGNTAKSSVQVRSSTSEVSKVENSSFVNKNVNIVSNVTESKKRETTNSLKVNSIVEKTNINPIKKDSEEIHELIPPKVDRYAKPSVVETAKQPIPEIIAKGKNIESTENKNNNNSEIPPSVKTAEVKLRVKDARIENKIEDLPKNVRLARRTSDLIANKIQSIFSKVSSEKEVPPVKAKPNNADSQKNCSVEISKDADKGSIELSTKSVEIVDQAKNISSSDIKSAEKDRNNTVDSTVPKLKPSLAVPECKNITENKKSSKVNIPIEDIKKSLSTNHSVQKINATITTPDFAMKNSDAKENQTIPQSTKKISAELKPSPPPTNSLSFLNGVEDRKMIAAALKTNCQKAEESSPIVNQITTAETRKPVDLSKKSVQSETLVTTSSNIPNNHDDRNSLTDFKLNGFQSPSFYLHPRISDDNLENSKRNSYLSLSSSSGTDISSSLNSEMGFRDTRSFIRPLSSSLPYSPPPRPPERRRPARDSSVPPPIPPHAAASISRTASLKRFEDPKVPAAVLRSPSHSCVPSYTPQRYSYTEMLSKVCSYGITPSSSTSSLPGKYSKYNSPSLSQVSELWSDLTQEQTSSSHATEILEAETSERMRLEKEIQDLQSRYSHVQQKSDKMEMEMMESRVYRTAEINGDMSGDDDVEGNSSIYKQKYERAVRDMEIMKRRVQQQHEEIMEQNLLNKKAADKKLAEALEDVEEERQVANQWKRKSQKLGSELQDLRLMLEEQMARNGELEKKQRKFDSELSACQEEIKKERVCREKATRERDQAHQEKYSLEQELHSTRLDMDMQHEKITQLNRELDELSLSSKGEEEVTQLKRCKQELERKMRDQEEELEELAGQVQMLEQAKLRLEMSLEKLRQEHRRESSVREEEIEELRASFSKKIKNLEAQLESEQEDRHQLVKQKHELERRVIELTDQPPPQDPEIERRLRRDLKRTKALLRDAQSMLEHMRDGQGNKSIIRQLKNQLEDAEFAKCAAIKAKQTAEMELQDSQLQLEEVTRTKNESESKCLQLSREKSTTQTQLEEMEEELTEVMKKFKASVAQLSIEQKTIAEQNQQITELEMERHALKEQLSEVSTKFEHLAGQSEDTGRVYKLDARVRDLESKLDLEQTTRGRLEHQIGRLKEQVDRMQEECDNLRNKELQAQEGIRRFQRQMRELREDYTALQQKEAEAYRKQHDLELALENSEGDLKVTKNDLRLACQRIEELKNALEDDLDSGTDVPDDSGSESDSSSLDISMLRQRMSSIQRCDSAASDLSFGSRRSITPSLGQEFSAMCSRDDVESEINGFPQLGESKLTPDSPTNQENLEV